jgi:hypothetical protein
MGNRCNCFAVDEDDRRKESLQIVDEKYENGDTYRGKKKAGKRHGFGKYEYKDGSKYEGEYANDLPNGVGCFYYSNGGYYNGQW